MIAIFWEWPLRHDRPLLAGFYLEANRFPKLFLLVPFRRAVHESKPSARNGWKRIRSVLDIPIGRTVSTINPF
jgi:hypothetical protein